MEWPKVKVLIQACRAGVHMALISSGVRIASCRCSSATTPSLTTLFNQVCSLTLLLPAPS